MTVKPAFPEPPKTIYKELCGNLDSYECYKKLPDTFKWFDKLMKLEEKLQ